MYLFVKNVKKKEEGFKIVIKGAV